MSAKSQDYVEDNSPYDGIAYMIHLRMGILANNTHGYTIFMRDELFAHLCRCSTKTLQRARVEMVKDGYLSLISPATKKEVAKWQFIFKGVGGIGGHFDQSIEMGGHLGQDGWTSTESSPTYVIKENSVIDTPSTGAKKKNEYTPEFEAWWKIYPKSVAKKDTFGSWNATLRERGGTIESVMLATSVFAKQMITEGRQKQHILNSDTFLGPNERWREYAPESFAPDILAEAWAWEAFDTQPGPGTILQPDFPRPQNSEGHLLDSNGRAYYIDQMDFKRRYLDNE